MNTSETANRILGAIDSAMTGYDNGLFSYVGVEGTSREDGEDGDLIVHVKLRDDKIYRFHVTCTPEVENA